MPLGRAARRARLRRDREAAAEGAAALDRPRAPARVGTAAAVAPELIPLIGDAPGPRVASRRRRLDPHAAGGRPGRPAARGPRHAARARRDAGRPVPRPGQAGHDADAGRPAALARSRGGGTATDERAARPLERPSPPRLRRARPRCSGWSAITSSPASSTTTASASATAPSAAWPESASPRCSIAWPAPTAWAGPGTSRPSRWSGSSIGCASSRWRSGRRTRCCRAATCSSWASRPGPRSAASCAPCTSASSTAPCARWTRRERRRGAW